MSRLFKFTVAHEDEFPGANFRVFDDIPTSECETASGVTTAEEIANQAHAQLKAHTFANGKLYTDLDVAEMTAFCSVTYAPQT